MKIILLIIVTLTFVAAAPTKKVAILGASGYTGAELMRILSLHNGIEVDVLTADRSAGQDYKTIYPQFSYLKNVPKLSKWEDSKEQIGKCDVAFCCLPHGTTQEIISTLMSSSAVKVVDLSADFRLKDPALYEKDIAPHAQWYGAPHAAVDLQKKAVYGLPEINRDEVKGASLIANPGCYPTAAQLALVPLLKKGQIATEDIIIDAKSGITGAGRAPKEAFLYCETADGMHAYGVASHRHAPEIEQQLSLASGLKEIVVNFTPHLIPMSRGILETIYVKLSPGQTAEDLKATLVQAYENEPFVHVLEGKALPQTRHVRGSNNCFINVVQDRLPGRAIIISAIDNVVKGAAGQAVQNMNLILGFPETTALLQAPMFP